MQGEGRGFESLTAHHCTYKECVGDITSAPIVISRECKSLCGEYCGVFRRWLPKRAHNPKTSVRVRLPQLKHIVLWSSWLRRQILNLKMVCSSHTGTSKNETMIKTVLHQTGGISLDAFNKLTAYVKKARPDVTERVGEHVRFSSN